MKFLVIVIWMFSDTSPPSRGAWIEIASEDPLSKYLDVAPLAGGVD